MDKLDVCWKEWVKLRNEAHRGKPKKCTRTRHAHVRLPTLYVIEYVEPGLTCKLWPTKGHRIEIYLQEGVLYVIPLDCAFLHDAE